ncbi:MAG: tRNA threonylcarbamoyladenosine biosynthesis protein TsaE [Thermotogota bacterium]|nr:tRNA threonylcarbamoyladenosine biosynthesis protein TsaE [Thermotogota bacterium]HCZ06847.1 tRNA (adenosine(37)-N6)-threonylcarbamoyltransferase complex ATPase subunit type 1 TsaE [Thermotogota bacterium]
MEGGRRAIEKLDDLDIEQLTEFGAIMGRLAYPSLNLLLVGDLGSGKTTFTKGFARGLGVDERLVRSPSFALMYIYPGRLELVHVDLYRLKDTAEIFYSGILDYFDSENGVLVIEWADKLGDDLPENWVKIRFTVKDPHHRELFLEGKGEREKEYIQKSVEVFRIAKKTREAG